MTHGTFLWFLGVRYQPFLWLTAKPSKKSMDWIEVESFGGQ